MTAGRGISHSEVSTPDARSLHGPSSGVALPDADRNTDPGFAHHAPEPVTGRLGGAGSSARCSAAPRRSRPLPVGGRRAAARARHRAGLDVDLTFEHGVLVDTGVLEVAGTEVKQHELAACPVGTDRLERRRTTCPCGCCCSAARPSGRRS